MRWGVNSEVQVGKNESVTRVCTSATQSSPQSDANSPERTPPALSWLTNPAALLFYSL
jgi:hypothetical protein